HKDASAKVTFFLEKSAVIPFNQHHFCFFVQIRQRQRQNGQSEEKKMIFHDRQNYFYNFVLR
ncbi:MAG: hypothetical protein LUI04_00380, partial [Porphyromonadaceae bacterium]|nr:hypothetical protein [Porphyromonadaceae bacterium]